VVTDVSLSSPGFSVGYNVTSVVSSDILKTKQKNRKKQCISGRLKNRLGRSSTSRLIMSFCTNNNL